LCDLPTRVRPGDIHGGCPKNPSEQLLTVPPYTDSGYNLRYIFNRTVSSPIPCSWEIIIFKTNAKTDEASIDCQGARKTHSKGGVGFKKSIFSASIGRYTET
jgi:hypothetical protein